MYIGAREEEQTQKFLNEAIEVGKLKLWATAQLDVFQNAFSWLTAVLPYLAVAQRYFSGELEYGVIRYLQSILQSATVCFIIQLIVNHHYIDANVHVLYACNSMMHESVMLACTLCKFTEFCESCASNHCYVYRIIIAYCTLLNTHTHNTYMLPTHILS
jgi:hypothetical protein